MAENLHPRKIHWKLHLNSSVSKVYRMLSTAEGREKYWAETAKEEDGYIHFTFPDPVEWKGKILETSDPYRYAVDYFGNTVTFTLADDGDGGTILDLTDESLTEKNRSQTYAGWISVLMALKAAVDHNVDLRNHDSKFSWDKGFCDN